MLTSLARRVVPEALKPSIRELRRLVERLGFREYTLTRQIFDQTVKLIVADRSARSWYAGTLSAAMVRELTFLRERLVRPGDIIFEAGAHHGFMTVLLAHWVGRDGRVVAFEANPVNADLLQRNVQLNGLNNVTVVAKAVGANEGETRITSDSNARVVVSGRRGQAVAMVPLDAFADLRPTMLKLDVEGFEVEALRGATKILGTRPKLALELHAAALATFGTSVEEVFKLYDFARAETHVDLGDSIQPFHHDLILDRRCHLFALPKVSIP